MITCTVCSSSEQTYLFKWGADAFVRCSRCGLVINRSQLEAAVSREVRPENKYYKGAEDVVFWRDNRAAIFQRHIARLQKEKHGGALLDIGCGFGHFLKMCSDAGYATAGVELDPVAVSYARDTYRLRVFGDELRKVALPTASYDIVTLWNVLDFFTDPDAELKEISRIMKDDGILIVRVPNAAVHILLHRIFLGLARIGKVRKEQDPSIFHAYGFNAKTLKLLLDKNGFTIYKDDLSASNEPTVLVRLFGKTGARAVAQLYVWAATALYVASGNRFRAAPSLCVYARKGKG